MQYGAKIDHNGWLHDVAKLGLYTALKFLMEHLDVNVRDAYGATPLHVACSSMQRRVLALLVGAGIDPNCMDSRGATPLHHATRNECSVDVVSEMVSLGGDINKLDCDGRSCLEYALSNDVVIAQRLVELGAKIDYPIYVTVGDKASYAGTLLHRAVEKGDENAVQFLLDYGANVDGLMPSLLVRSDGSTPLHIAVRLCKPTLVEILIKHGADPGAVDSSGDSSEWISKSMGSAWEKVSRLLWNSGSNPAERHVKLVFRAAKYNRADILDGVVAWGTDPNARLKLQKREGRITPVNVVVRLPAHQGATALSIAAEYGSTQCCSVLINLGADLLALNDKSEIPLETAIRGGHFDSFAILLPVTEPVWSMSIGYKCLWAALCGLDSSLEMANRLLACGVPLIDGESSLLHRASLEGRFDAVAYLLSHGADPQYGLHCAARCNLGPGNRVGEIARLLVDSGADCWAQDSDGNTPLHIALLSAVEEDVLKPCPGDHDHSDTSNNTLKSLYPSIAMCRILLQTASVRADLFKIENSNGRTCLDIALQSGIVSCVVVSLVGQGASVNDNLSAFAHRASGVVVSSDPIDFVFNGDGTGLAPLESAEDAQPLALSDSIHVVETDSIMVGPGGSGVPRNRDESGTLLHRAARHGHVDVVKFLIARGANTLALDSLHWTPLHTAAGCGCSEAVKVLLANGIYVNHRVPSGPAAGSWSGMTPLHVAVAMGQNSIISLLAQNQCDVNSLDDLGRTPLQIALWGNRLKVGEVLVHVGADVNAAGTDKDEQLRLLESVNTAKSTHSDDRMLDTAQSWDQFNTMLHASCRDGFANITSFLIEHNARKSAQNSAGLTPLHCSASMGHQSCTFVLLSAGRDAARALADMTDSRGRVALHAAATHPGTVAMLLDYGADPNVRDKMGTTPMLRACQIGVASLDVTRTLISRGGDPSLADSNGLTPLHAIAMAGGDVKVARLLLSGKSNKGGVRQLLDAMDENGWTPLHCASMSGFTTLCESLSMYGAAVNIPDQSGNTPLDLGMSAGYSNVPTPPSTHATAQQSNVQAPVIAINAPTPPPAPPKNNGIEWERISLSSMQRTILKAIQSEPIWLNDSKAASCQICRNKFSVRIRRHHCRHCGRVICGTCSPFDHPIEKFGHLNPQRVCIHCFDVLIPEHHESGAIMGGLFPRVG